MRGPTRLIGSNVVGRLGRARPPAVRGVARGTYALAALLMLLNVLAPMVGTQSAAAAPAVGASTLANGLSAPHPGTPPPFPAPSRVAVVGDFQSAVGCTNGDTNCSATELQSDGSGLWSAVIAIPAGRYTYRVLVSSDQDRLLGQNGDPQGNDLSLRVPDGSAGVYFSYDQFTGQVVAEPVAHQVELATDLGNFPMAPTSDGGFEVYIDAQRNAQFNAQVTIDGNAVGDPVQVSAGRSGRVHVVADANGTITATDNVTPSTLAVTKSDDSGNPLTGACFTVYDARDNVLSQACDVDDGEDGVTTLAFPNGVNARRTVLAETFTPDGQPTADDQPVSIDPGNNQVDVTVSGGGQVEQPTETPSAEQPTETPVEQPTEGPATYQYNFVAVDDQNNPLPGACYSIDGGDPQCDDDNDGTVTITMTAGDHTLSETQAPDGYEGFQDTTITAPEGGETFQIPQTLVAAPTEAAPTETPTEAIPTETPTEAAPATGTLQISKVDQDGNPLPGSCYTITPRSGTAGTEVTVCDADDGSDDGSITVEGLSVGRWRVEETTVPDGYQAARPFNADITAGETTTQTVTDTAAAPTTGNFTAYTVDDQGNPVGGVCFTVVGSNGNDLGQNCDENNNGDMALTDIPADTYTVTMVSVPDGYELDPNPQTVEVAAGADARADFTSPKKVETGALVVDVTDENGNGLGGACVSVNGPKQTEVCDNQNGDGDPGDGKIRFDDLPAGDYSVDATQLPQGYQAPATVTATVTAGQDETVTLQPVVPTPVVTPEPVGSVLIRKVDENGSRIEGACFSLEGAQNYGPVCDNGDGDADTGAGRILIDGVVAGDYTLNETTAPTGYTGADPQTITVTGDETTRVTVQNTAQAGAIRITKTDASGAPLAGACFAVDGGDPVCDNDQNDGDNTDGTIVIGNLAAGQHAVSETTAPDGYATAADQQVEVAAGQTAEVSFADELLPTETPVPTEVPTETPTEIPTEVPTETPTEIPTETPTEVPTEVPTETPTEVPTETPTEVPTETPTEIPTEIPIVIPTDTPTEVPTEQPTEEATSTEIGIAFPTETAEATQTATAEATQTATESATEAPTEVPTVEPTAVQEFGSVQITKQDENGNALGGACFELSGASDVGPVCDNDPSDTNADNGTIVIANVLTGDYTLTETQAPDGFTVADDSPLTVQANQTADVTVVDKAVPVTTGNLQITSVGPDGSTAGGGCYQINGQTVCDNGDGDGDNAPGSILIAGILTGDYTVTETQAPDGFQTAAAQPVTVAANQTATLTFTHEAAPVETGGLRLQLQDPNGKSAPGGCVTLSSQDNGQTGQEYCDNGKGDSDSSAGSLEIKNLPVGSYTITQSNVPGEATASVTASGVRAEFAPGQPQGPANTLHLAPSPYEKTCTVQANVIIIVIIIIIIEPPHAGDLQVVKRAADTNQLQPGACFQVTGPSGTIELCDNDGFDASGTVGVIRFNDLNFGSYTVKETTAPPGYQKAANVTVNVNDSGVTSVTIKDQPLNDTTGSLIVHKIDENGDPLKGSCFELLLGNSVVAGPLCDNADGNNDGKLTFKDIEKGTYTLRETTVPSADYDGAPDQPVTIIAGNDTKTIDVVNTLKPGNILITKTAEDGSTLLTGACFGLDRGAGVEFEACDQEASDGDGEEGIIYIANVPAGDWKLIETQAPAGYDPAADQDITVKPGQTLNLIIKDTPTPPPSQTGTLVVNKVDGKGKPLAGACFSLSQGNVVKASRCDNADGNADGTTTFTNIATGTYKLHETKKPSQQYLQAPDSNVTITANQTKTVKVINTLQNGRLVVRKTNQQGQLLQNGCFTITPDPNGAGELCTDASGQVTFSNLPTDKVYKITETKAPNGYVTAAQKTNITLTPGLTTTITFVDKKKQPQPKDGSILIVKFFCPAGKSGPTTVTLDTSNPGPNKLAQTANCKKGGADFVIKPKGGGTGIVFNTGSDGQYQTTLKAGDYVLTEQASGKQETFTVYVNQQTTIVVLNYVAPPKPKPVTIKVTKYTCDPGFEAVYFADFVANCGDASQLTNGVAFRVSGAAVQKRTTGIGGQKGQATFSQLPAGDYELSEDVPAGATTVYGFCGYDPNAPDWKVVGDTIDLSLGQGDVITCTFFNVPDDLSDSTGAIVVHKYVCDIQGKVPTNFDWFANCDVFTDGAKFALSVKQGTKFVPSKTGITTADGILRFGQLKPGTYQLKEVGANWCHAESDNVDAQGNVLVRAGERSNVWIFNCVKTNRPPNTGAGTTAAPKGTASISAPMPNSGMLLFGLAWPLFGAGLYGLRRRKPARAHTDRRAA